MNGGLPVFIFIFAILIIIGIIFILKSNNKNVIIIKNEKQNPKPEVNKNTNELEKEYYIYSKANVSEVIINKVVIEELKQYIANHSDNLVGGYLVGNQEGLISEFVQLSNVSANSKFEFIVDLQEQFIEISKITKAKKIILGQFLSKIDEPAYPSEFDIINAVTPNISYLYISIGTNLTNDVRAYGIEHSSKQVKERVVVLK